MDKKFEEIFSRQPDEIIDGAYLYHNLWYEKELAEISIMMNTSIEELRKQREESWFQKQGFKTFWEYKTFYNSSDLIDKSPLLMAMYENIIAMREKKINKILNKIAIENKPFMEISCGDSMGLFPFIVKINPQIPCLITDIDIHMMKHINMFINSNLPKNNINIAAFDNYDIPIKNNSLDYIVSIRGITDISSSDDTSSNFFKLTVGKEKAINEIYRILKPGGHFVTIELNEKWKFNSEKIHKAYKRYGKLFEVYTYDDIKEIQNKLKAPSWYEQFTDSGFQIKVEEKYPQKISKQEIKVMFYNLINTIKLTNREKENFDLLMNRENFDEIANNYGIEFFQEEIFYVLRKENKSLNP